MMVTRDRVEARLAANGYRMVRDRGDHALYEHHGDRIVIPLHSHELSSWSARVIEWSLEPRLGRGWLTDPPVAPPATASAEERTRSSVHLNLVIRPEQDLSAWNAFVAEEPRILTFGATFAEVRRRAADAVEAWFAETAVVDLDLHPQLGADADQWLARADGSVALPAELVEARRQLRLLGFAAADVDDLLAWTPTAAGATAHASDSQPAGMTSRAARSAPIS